MSETHITDVNALGAQVPHNAVPGPVRQLLAIEPTADRDVKPAKSQSLAEDFQPVLVEFVEVLDAMEVLVVDPSIPSIFQPNLAAPYPEKSRV